MSTYYDFYLAVKKDDKIEAIGPYIWYPMSTATWR